MPLRLLPLLAFLLCAASQPAPAIGADTPDMIARLQKQYTEIKGFTADFEQILTHKESGAAEKRRGKLLFKKPLLIRWETAKPHQELLVVTAKDIWDYLPDEELAYRYSLSMVRDSRGIIQVITGQAALTRDFEVRPEGADGGLAKFRLYPKEPDTQMVEAIIWVEKNDASIRGAEIIDFYGNKNEVRFTSFKPMTQFKDADFSFSPPKGVEVEDHSGNNKPERRLFN